MFRKTSLDVLKVKIKMIKKVSWSDFLLLIGGGGGGGGLGEGQFWWPLTYLHIRSFRRSVWQDRRTSSSRYCLGWGKCHHSNMVESGTAELEEEIQIIQNIIKYDRVINWRFGIIWTA